MQYLVPPLMAFAMFFAVLFSAGAAQATNSNTSIIINNVHIVSSHLGKTNPNQHVFLKNGRIAMISDHPIPISDIPVVDGTGMYLTPGLMDSHVHVSSIPGMGFGVEPVAQQHPKLVEEYYRQQPRSFLYHGVTQVLDLNPGLNWQQFVEGEIHPDFNRCEVITSKETFPLVEKQDDASKAMFQHLVNEQAQPNEPDSAEQIVKRISQSGAVCIKVYFEDGYGKASHWPLLTEQTLSRIRQAANLVNLVVLAHANALDMYQMAIKADVDVIVHGMWNWGNDANASDITPTIIKTLNNMVARKMGYMPSQRVIAGLGEVMLPKTKANPAFAKVTPQSLLNWYKTEEANWFVHELQNGFDGVPAQSIAEIFLNGRVGKGAKVMQHFEQQQHPILLGSDFPGSPGYANQPGLSTYQEMLLMADAGVSLFNVMKAATTNNAEQFGMQNYGTIEVGKVANLLLLQANPLETINAWNQIHSVILHGKVLPRESLAANLGQ